MKTKPVYRFSDGLRDGVPIGLGYLSVSFGFGITAVGEGLRIAEALFFSMTNLTSAGQVAGASLIVAGATLLEMILTQLVINLRYSLMGISLTQRLDANCTPLHRFFMSFGVTDEIFAVAVSKPRPISPSYFYGLMTAPYVGWAVGTLLGAVAGQLLPDSLRMAMEMMIYAMFVAIVLPPMKRNRGVLATVIVAAALRCAMTYLPILQSVTSGFAVIICSILAAGIVSLILPVTDGGGKEATDAD